MKKFLPLALTAVSALIFFLVGLSDSENAHMMVMISLIISVAGFIVFKTIYKSDSVIAGIGRIGCASMIVINAVYIVTFMLIGSVLPEYIGRISI